MKELKQGEPRTCVTVEIFQGFQVFGWEQGRAYSYTRWKEMGPRLSQTHSMTLIKVHRPCLGFHFPVIKHSMILNYVQILSD